MNLEAAGAVRESGFQTAPTGIHARSSGGKSRKTTSFTGIFCNGSLTIASPVTHRYKGECAWGSVRLLDNSRLETKASANLQEPVAVIRIHAIQPDKRFFFQKRQRDLRLVGVRM